MEHDINIIGERETWGRFQPFGICAADRRQHLYVLGKSGTGKTTLLRNLILQDIYAGHGVAVIDPHGDLAADIAAHVPRWRTEDTVYFNPADAEFPMSLNLLHSVKASHRHLVVSSMVSVFKGIWRDSWGPRLEYILSATLAALVEAQNASLLGVQRMLSDRRYRAWVVRQVKDPMVRSFWENEFENYGKAFMQEAVSPIQNKVGQLLMAPHLRNILGQVPKRVDARFMMDNRRIFIADVSKGKLGAEASSLLGALLVTNFQLAAMSRADIPEHERKDFFLYVDEFQSFTSDSFISILSEARKYRLCLTLSHQYIDQVTPDIRNAVFGNVGSMVIFRVGHGDAEVLEKEFGGVYRASQFSGLNNHEIVARILAGGEHTEPFLARTLAPVRMSQQSSDSLARRSREKYAAEKLDVENRITRWLGNRF